MAQRGDEFWIEIQDIRHCVEDEGDTLTLLWVLEGRAELNTDAGRDILEANTLAIINRHRRWQFTSETANVTLRVTLSGRWVVQLCNDFFAHDYAVPAEAGGVWPQCDALRDLLRQLLVVTLINDPHRYRLEAYRWLSEILLLLTSRFQQPARMLSRELSSAHSKRIARVIERINASYSRRITLAEIAASEYVSEAWLSRLFRKEVGISFMQYITHLRLEKAADALRLTNRPLHQIALEQGFASTRMMSDRFRRVHNMSPGEFRKARRQHPEAARVRADRREQRYPVAVDKLFSLLNEPVARGWGASPLVVHPQQEQRLDLEQLNPLSASLRRMRVVITLRELDDLLREDVRQNLEAINEAIPIEGIDIAEPFLSSRLFATGWDDPQMAGYACWYNLHQLFTWLAKKQWTVLLHTGVTTRRDLLTRFLQQSVNHFAPEITAGWHFVMHWSTQASEETREQVWLAGFWLNSGLQGEARANNTIDTSSLALQYNHGLPRPVYWVLWLWQRLRGEVLVNDKRVLLTRHRNGYQLLLRNVVVFNPLLSGEEAFIQRFRQQYHLHLKGMRGKWRIKCHLFDQHNGALYPLLEGVGSESGPDEEMWRWIAHKARPTLSVRDERLYDGWQLSESLESNALVLYEFTPLVPHEAETEEIHSPR
ncbi:helix-turn-helix domain-containing protein [Enterobacter hormaechei]|uniref:helix-turn-helix domain-containing protein n=1 Tax=Enterobacter hormaechei TaxID=158836 RepID=UPI0020760133|nr:helix-turn-helix domain-containing protein [Enterobacter hormaechei]MCM7955735.1 helix-turn-helix domain-containing protein [Enterobacter hormaechei]MCM7979754.1 helix-turn-helix domain-containing protein [Enterobacter hormaechei]MCM7984538.1 helix-turn-helix domain-containing protein [Enterobacter hormaechei]MCM8234917.1 helix-turn-helix domain-containing protein [Enterobacter hormaechei]HBN1558364.1 helix-turn-helix domain-containing protein [Enterobacter hormaechei]